MVGFKTRSAVVNRTLAPLRGAEFITYSARASSPPGAPTFRELPAREPRRPRVRLKTSFNFEPSRRSSIVEKNLSGKRVAILVAEGFEQSELEGPKQALEDAGAEALIVSPAEEGWVQGWQHFDLGDLYE